jgi:hydrogenase expression/formation protein HypE
VQIIAIENVERSRNVFTKSTLIDLKQKMSKTISLNHGSGGLLTRNLINDLFVKYFNNNEVRELTDSAILNVTENQLAFTTDGYVVDPIFFPGGNIGKLAVCGTVNDLAVSGAKPMYLSSSFIIEEGFSYDDLETIVKSMADEAKAAGVKIVAGDTKVVNKGKCDKLFITTSGVGVFEKNNTPTTTGKNIEIGDKIIINGNIGDHSIAITSVREKLRFETQTISDCASLNGIIALLTQNCKNVRFMRDATRGGLGAVTCELAEMVNLGIELDEDALPISEPVQSACEIFGYDPLFLANEGKFLAVVPANEAQMAVETLRKHPLGQNAAIIGEVTNNNPGKVILKTFIGGKRLITLPMGAQLPRIC